MKAILVLFDSLNRKYLPSYGCDWTKMPSFERLAERTAVFDRFYSGSMPCMPARCELHTGRYNFLHTPWAPLQPYDDSILDHFRKAGIYSHLSTDHFHYWEVGGSGYMQRFDSFEMVRGQQGDTWKGQVDWPLCPETLSRRRGTENWRHDWVNRSFMTKEEDMPQYRTFENGLDFIERSHDKDNWFLQIEEFDPHEPFFTQDSYKELYDDMYSGANLDWPDYGRNHYGESATEHVRYEYAALLSMCDRYLGKLLDMMDLYSMWEDTMLIVCTDHGFMLGEKEWMGKNIQPIYEELSHLPFFIHDPRHPEADGTRRNALAQTVDVVPTLASYFGTDAPGFMDGKDLEPAIAYDQMIREGALFGVYGMHVNVTDGRYVYMKAPVSRDNQPLNIYTLMPMHMRTPFTVDELADIELTDGFAFSRGAKLLKIRNTDGVNPYWYGSRLYDLETDPEELHPIRDNETEKRLAALMRSLMKENEAPSEQFARLGIPEDGEITDELIESYHRIDYPAIAGNERLTEDGRLIAAVIISISGEKAEKEIGSLLEGASPVSGRDLIEKLSRIPGFEKAASIAELYL